MMKKINFLSSLSACAMAAVMLTGAAILTSCAKEELSVNTTPVEQAPATVSINPVVLDLATGRQIADAAISFSGADCDANGVITGKKNIAGGTVTVTAIKNGATGTATVSVSALAAGQSATYAPVVVLSTDAYTFEYDGPSHVDYTAEPIVLNAGYTTKADTYTHDGWTVGHDTAIDHQGNTWAVNMSDMFVDYTLAWAVTGKCKVEIENANIESGMVLEATEAEYKIEGEAKFVNISAWSIFRAWCEAYPGTVWLNVYSKATGIQIGYARLATDVAAVMPKSKEEAIPGYTEHDYQHGHGHGHNPNAGGGFVVAD